jgi:5'-nucleotidase
MKTILITNDDGYMSKGLTILTEELSYDYDVFVIAPDRERSAVSMGLTLNSPLRIKKITDKRYITNGTPVDCVTLGVKLILKNKPDLIVSGINFGENISEDIFYSGTVAAAFAGHLHSVNSIAVSYVLGKIKSDVSDERLKQASAIAHIIIDDIINRKFEDTVYNLNIPVPNNGKVLSTYPDKKKYAPELVEKTDPRGGKYYWMGTGNPYYSDEFGTDSNAIKEGYISLSTLKYDLSCKEKKHGEIINNLSHITEKK